MSKTELTLPELLLKSKSEYDALYKFYRTHSKENNNESCKCNLSERMYKDNHKIIELSSYAIEIAGYIEKLQDEINELKSK